MQATNPTQPTYYNDNERVAVELARVSIQLSTLVDTIYSLERVNPSIYLYDNNAECADNALQHIAELTPLLRTLAGALDRQAMYKAECELNPIAR